MLGWILAVLLLYVLCYWASKSKMLVLQAAKKLLPISNNFLVLFLNLGSLFFQSPSMIYISQQTTLLILHKYCQMVPLHKIDASNDASIFSLSLLISSSSPTATASLMRWVRVNVPFFFGSDFLKEIFWFYSYVVKIVYFFSYVIARLSQSLFLIHSIIIVQTCSQPISLETWVNQSSKTQFNDLLPKMACNSHAGFEPGT